MFHKWGGPTNEPHCDVTRKKEKKRKRFVSSVIHGSYPDSESVKQKNNGTEILKSLKWGSKTTCESKVKKKA